MNDNVIIQAEKVQKYFNGGAIKALDGVSAQIQKGEVVVVIGPSGSGKSTFLRCLNLLELPTGGKIFFKGADITNPKADINLYRQKMGMVFQHFNLFPHMTILKNMTLAPTQLLKKSREAAEAQAMTLLDAYLSGMFPKDENGNMANGSYYINSDNSSAEEMENASLMQSLVLGAIAGISLLVGGIGIMNIMLVTVTERTREIGIRKAIGAERSSIITQFLIEAAVICGIGGLIGIGIGYVGTMIAGKLMENVFEGMILTPDPMIAIGAFLFSVVLGILFGMFPAIKASGLQPVEALRAD